MLTIHQLEVHFDVEGSDDEVFARMFAAHIARWSRSQEAARARARRLEQERSITDDANGSEQW